MLGSIIQSLSESVLHIDKTGNWRRNRKIEIGTDIRRKRVLEKQIFISQKSM